MADRRKNSKRLSSRRDVTRRKFISTGSAGLMGTAGLLGSSNMLGSGAPLFGAAGIDEDPSGGLPGFGRAKQLIILYLYGAPSQMETLDPKIDGPSDMRGAFKSIPTRYPGIHVSELLPDIGKIIDKFALVRTFSHESNNHAASVTLSGIPRSEPAIEANGKDDRHWPYFGSVLEYLWKQQGVDATKTGIPVHMILPWHLNSKTDPRRWVPNAGWLGTQYNPVLPIFDGKGALEKGLPTIQGQTPIFSRHNPFHATTPESTFRFEGTQLPESVSKERFEARRQLLGHLDAAGAELLSGRGDSMARYQDVAFRMIADPRVAEAVDVTRESEEVREKFGHTLVGMEFLAARRLIQAGVKVVTAIWDTYGDNNAAWDTHVNALPRLKNFLCPTFNKVLPAFVEDMERHGLLEDTLVMCISEHGRTPKITNCAGSGREHWSGAYWGLFFGAGIKTAQVIGETDKVGAFPITDPYNPKDVLATMYHLLGFPPHLSTVPDRNGRPTPILPFGKVMAELLA